MIKYIFDHAQFSDDSNDAKSIDNSVVALIINWLNKYCMFNASEIAAQFMIKNSTRRYYQSMK